MRKKKECDCRNVSNCMFWEGADPLKMTYFDGTLIYRALRLEEVGRHPQIGDALSKLPSGKVFVTAVALDPERAAAFATRGPWRKCKADRPTWRRLNPPMDA